MEKVEKKRKLEEPSSDEPKVKEGTEVLAAVAVGAPTTDESPMQTETSTAQRSVKRSAETPIEKIDPSSTQIPAEEGTSYKRQAEMETEQLQRSEASGSAGPGLMGQAP